MSNAVALPILLPLVTALALVPAPGPGRIRRRLPGIIAMGSALLLLAAVLWLAWATWGGRVLALPVGDWVPGLGIVWVVDRLSAIMLTLAAVGSLATLVYAPAALRRGAESRWFPSLHQLLLVGVNGSFITGDLFNLFVFYEVMLVASFVLVSLGARPQQLVQAFPYVIINLVASALLFGGVGLVYATAGTVNMAELAVGVARGELPPVFWGGLVIALSVFALKSALVPFFFWLPDSYPQSTPPVNAFFAGLLTKVGVYTLFRTLTLFAEPAIGFLPGALLAISALTMILGVLGALGRGSVRGILSFHIVSQVGYMVFGLALFTPAGVAAGLFFVVHQIVVKTALLLAGGIVDRVGGGDLGVVHGLASAHPWSGVAFFVPAMALAGIPPLSGFWAKLFLLIAGFEAGAFVTTTVAVVVSLFTLASMLKIWFGAYWGAPANITWPSSGEARRLVGAPLGLAALSVAMGLGAPPLYAHVDRTARALLDKQPYVGTVLGLRELRAAVTTNGGGGRRP